MSTHVGVYVRQSERRDSGSEASTAAQRASCLKAISRMLEVPAHVEHYEDLGISAFKDVQRPAYEQLLSDVRRGRINLIVVHYVSRLSRKSPMETFEDLRPLLAMGLRIFSVGDNQEFHADNQFALMSLLFKLQASHEESKNKSIAVKNAKDLEASLGGYTGKPPFGFCLVRETRRTPHGSSIVLKMLTPQPEEARAVVRAVEIAEGYIVTGEPTGSLWKLARQLNTEGVPTRGGRSGKETANSVWDSRTVKRILRDPRIAGFKVESIYGSRADGAPSNKVAEYRIVRDSEGKPIQAYAPTISPERWLRLQEWLDGFKPGGQQKFPATSGLLSAMRLLFCECGSIMTCSGNSHKQTYRCRRRKPLPGQHSGECTIGAKGIEQYVARRIFSVMQAVGDELALAVMAEATSRYAQQCERKEAPGITHERDRLLSERGKVRRAREQHNADKRRTMLAGGFVDDFARDEWEITERVLAERMRAIDTRVAEICGAEHVELPLERWLPTDCDPIGPGSWWHCAPREEKRAFLRLFLDRIEVSKAFRHAGQSVPAERRVRFEWAGAVRLDVSAETAA